MVLDPYPHAAQDPPATPSGPFQPGRVAIAGVFGACALGLGLGLWARPAPPSHPMASQADVPSIQVVVSDAPLPATDPLDVLPGDLALVQPSRGAAGLVRVDAVVAESAGPVLPTMPARTSDNAADQSPPLRTAAPGPQTARKAAGSPRAAQPEPIPRVRRVSAAKAETASTAVRQIRPQKAASKRAEVKVATAKPNRPVAGSTPNARRAEAARTFKRSEAKPAVKAKSLAKAKPAAASSSAKLVKAKAAMKPNGARPAKVAEKRAPPRRTSTPGATTRPRGEGPLRQAPDACARTDPGEAMVCADSRLAARDRQLQTAYRNAEAAGVPSAALRRQQARWIQARAAAAREAPWAVEDVYEARISELNALSRDARVD